MRFTATLLSTSLAVLFIGGTGPVSAPYAGLEPTCSPLTDAAGTAHAYFHALASRPDCFAAYSLRDAAQIEQHRRRKDRPPSVFYLYPNDPDPRRQDAMKILLEPDTADLRTQVVLPIGPHHPKNLLITWDVWWGREYDFKHSNIWIQKGMPQFGSPDARIWLSVHANFQAARQHEGNLPPGGPYVVMTHPHSSNGANVKAPFYRDNATVNGVRIRERLPYGVPSKEQRAYREGVGPRDTSVHPHGMEFGVVAERWTRYWSFFERAEGHDWESRLGLMRAYRWSLWGADTDRAPVRILDDAIVAVHPDAPEGFGSLRIEMDVSGADDVIPPGRGPLVSYTRNYVALHGTSKADVLAMLRRPVI
jgi:hypothetical protein